MRSYNRLLGLAPICALVFTWTMSFGASPDVVIAAAEIGLIPEALVANSLQASAESLMNRISAAAALRQELTSLRQALSSTALDLLAAQRGLELNPADSSHRAQYETAMSQLQGIQDAIAQIRQSLFAEATADLTPEHVQRLIVWNTSNGRQVPAEFRVKQRTDQQWLAIETALIAERRAARLGRVLAPEHVQLLTEIRSEPDVVQAASNLQQHLAATELVFAPTAAQTQPSEGEPPVTP